MQINEFHALFANNLFALNYNVFKNRLKIICPNISVEQIEEFVGHFGTELATATVNKWNNHVSIGICVND